MRRLTASIVLLMVSLAIHADTVKLVFNMGFEPDSGQALFQTRLAGEIFSRLNIETGFIRVPAERALRNVDQGIEDGNLIRIAGLEATYPNIVAVPESVITYDFVAFTHPPGFPTPDWQSLDGRSVGIVTGWKILEENITDAGRLMRARNGEQLFEVLARERIEVAVYERLQGRELCKKTGLGDYRILEPPLARRPMFIYLNRRHSQLLPRVAEQLRAMKRDGSYARIHEDVFGIPPLSAIEE